MCLKGFLDIFLVSKGKVNTFYIIWEPRPDILGRLLVPRKPNLTVVNVHIQNFDSLYFV